MSPEAFATFWLAATRFLAYVSAAITMGAAMELTLALPRWWQDEAHRFAARAWTSRLASGLGLVGAVALIVANAGRLAAQAYATFGTDEPLRWEHARIIVFETAWGRGWIVQMASAAFATLAALWFRWRPRPGLQLIALVPIVVAAGLPLTGHAVASAREWLVVPVQIGHVFGVGLWLGRLVVVLSIVASLLNDRSRFAEAAALLRAFSPHALTGAALIVASGVTTGALYVGSVPALWESAYGRALSLKVLLFVGVAGCGAYNWRRVTPSLAQGRSTPARVRRAIAVELVLAALALAVTAVLTGLEKPGEG